MAAFVLNLKRVNPGQTLSTGSVAASSTSETQVNQELARSPDNMTITIGVISEAQLRAFCHYAVLINAGIDTSSIETEISAQI
jgi:hypothetical protein